MIGADYPKDKFLTEMVLQYCTDCAKLYKISFSCLFKKVAGKGVFLYPEAVPKDST